MHEYECTVSLFNRASRPSAVNLLVQIANLYDLLDHIRTDPDAYEEV